jgi:hypothetical protein
MRYGLPSRKFGALFLAGGLLLVGLTTLLPLWEAQHGEAGSSVSIGIKGMQAAFAAPTMILFGLGLVFGGDGMMARVEGDKAHGRRFWCAFAALGILLGGTHVWWFKHEMATLGYRDAYPGHMTKQSSRSAPNPATTPLMLSLPSEGSSALEKAEADLKRDMWEKMSPEMQKQLPELAPTTGRPAP